MKNTKTDSYFSVNISVILSKSLYFFEDHFTNVFPQNTVVNSTKMYRISHSDNELKAKHSSACFCEDPVENLIKKYTYVDCSDQQVDSSCSKNHSLYKALNRNKLPGTFTEGYGHSSSGVSSNRIFDNHLYNFFANYCKEEIRKEVDLKVSTNNSKDSTVSSIKNNLHQKEFVDKATYCRPVFNLYNRDFIFKTLERNAKLKNLIQKLITAHQRKKQNEAWNNFINILKSKHSHNNHANNLPSYEETLDIAYDSKCMDDCYDWKESSWQSSIQCEGLLEDIYANSNEIDVFSDQTKEIDVESNKYDQHQSRLFQRYPYCYPTSSVGRLSMIQRENELSARLTEKEKRIRDIYSNQHQRRGINIREDKKTIESKQSKLRNMTAQTESTALKLPDRRNRAIDVRPEVQKDTILPKSVVNIEQITQTLESQPENSVKNMSLKEMEKKLELLINSINNLIGEFKVNKNPKIVSKPEINNHFNHLRNVVVGSNVNQKCHYPGKSYSNSESILPKDKCSKFFEKCKRENSDLKRINEIFSRQLGDNASSNKTCAVQITFDVPTKEISTEITKSLSQARKTLIENDKIEEIIIPEPQAIEKIAIAVNTDPLNILTLLRISTQAMKRFLSYMPNIDYYYYLSRFYLPQLPSVETRFVCNICGAKFSKASELSDHIQEHDLGKAKECGICRHVLDMSRRPTNIYSCRHCGQCFARSYCCELHQETCARRLEKIQDVTNSNLLILR